MMPLSGWILGLAALLTSPALWSGLVAGTMPIDVALTRYLLTTAACWLVLSVVADLIWPSTSDTLAEEEAPQDSPVSDH